MLHNQYQVIMKLDPKYQLDPDALSMLYIRSSGGQLVPLNAVANITKAGRAFTVNHFGQKQRSPFFNLRPDVSLGEAISSIHKVAAKTLLNDHDQLPGTAQAFESSMQGLGLLLLMAILVIYLVLGILYESFIHPLTILSDCLPPASARC